MPQKRARSPRLRVRIALSVLGLAIVVSAITVLGSVHPSDLASALAQIRPGALLVATIAVVVQLLLVVTRLWWLLPAPRPRWHRVAYAFSLGQVVNTLVPMRSGDAVKAILLAREPGERPTAEILGVMIGDTLIDMTMLVVLVAWVGPGDIVHLGSRWSGPVAIAVILATAAVVIYSLRRNAKVQSVVRGLRVLRDPRRLVGGLMFSTGNWTAEVIGLEVLTGELGGSLGFANAIRVLFLFNLAIVVPVSIANIGTFEAPIAFGLRSAGLTFSAGLAVGTAYHGVQIVGVLLLAGASLLGGVRWGRAVPRV